MTKTSPGLTFHPAAEMKAIRVSTCLCHFHVISICKAASPIAAQLRGEHAPICRSGASEEPIGASLAPDPALPDTLPWEKQHGPIAGCSVSSLTRRTSDTSAALCPTLLLDLPRNKGRGGPAAASWEGASLTRSKLRPHHTPPAQLACFIGWDVGVVIFLKSSAGIWHRRRSQKFT